jgi:hypothetical protein
MIDIETLTPEGVIELAQEHGFTLMPGYWLLFPEKARDLFGVSGPCGCLVGLLVFLDLGDEALAGGYFDPDNEVPGRSCKGSDLAAHLYDDDPRFTALERGFEAMKFSTRSESMRQLYNLGMAVRELVKEGT